MEAREFRDTIKKFSNKGVTILGISPDTSKAQAKFRDKNELNFTLLADDAKAICKKYDVLKEKNMYGKKVMGVVRTTFVIENGCIAKIFHDVKFEGHAAQVLEAV